MSSGRPLQWHPVAVQKLEASGFSLSMDERKENTATIHTHSGREKVKPCREPTIERPEPNESNKVGIDASHHLSKSVGRSTKASDDGNTSDGLCVERVEGRSGDGIESTHISRCLRVNVSNGIVKSWKVVVRNGLATKKGDQTYSQEWPKPSRRANHQLR